MLQARVIQDRGGNVLTGTRSALGRCADYLMKEEDEREQRIEEMSWRYGSV